MKFGIVIGSMQNDSQSAKVAAHIAHELQLKSHQTISCNLGEEPLPMWNTELDNEQQSRLAMLKQELSDCDGFVIISPEYHGMVPAALKNFFLHFGKEQLGHKPAYIVAVSAGAGGAYPVAELRMSSYKNSRLVYIPEHTIVRQVSTVLNPSGDNNEKSHDYIRQHIDYCLSLLCEYSQALATVRQAGVINYEKFVNGM